MSIDDGNLSSIQELGIVHNLQAALDAAAMLLIKATFCPFANKSLPYTANLIIDTTPTAKNSVVRYVEHEHQ